MQDTSPKCKLTWHREFRWFLTHMGLKIYEARAPF
jgi:hypothetical protein